ncbi:MAG TPA: hypothetical protein PKL77_06200 [Candidatus Omnitrophota bacterium]|nr:hypothetical protein [Candidatus Omnitrophota bacterium]
MNKQQRQYAVCKSVVEVIEAEIEKIESDYIVNHRIINPDGSIPSHMWCIEPDEAFDAACEAVGPAVDALNLAKAESALRQAEDALIEYGLSIVPEGIKNILYEKALGKTSDYVIRKKIIDVTFRHDPHTVPRI